MHVISYQECLECYRGASGWTADIMVFSYYQPSDPLTTFSLCTDHTEGGNKILTHDLPKQPLSKALLNFYVLTQDVQKDTMLQHDTPLGSGLTPPRFWPWLSHKYIPVPSGNILLSRPTVSMSSKNITPLTHGLATKRSCLWLSHSSKSSLSQLYILYVPKCSPATIYQSIPFCSIFHFHFTFLKL